MNCLEESLGRGVFVGFFFFYLIVVVVVSGLLFPCLFLLLLCLK
jgi:hypothetical protein